VLEGRLLSARLSGMFRAYGGKPVEA
jgi:hypothetical protein